MSSTGLFLLGDTKGLAHAARYIVRACHLVRVFGDRLHHRDDVENLEATLLRFLDRLLPGDHQHRHAAQRRIGSRRNEVRGAWPQGGEANPRLPGVTPVSGRYEARALLMARQDQLDLPGTGKRIEEIEVLFPWNAEDIFYPFRFQAFDE